MTHRLRDNTEWKVLTINLKTKRGKYFLKHLIHDVKHISTVEPNTKLGCGWFDYTLHVEDYDRIYEQLSQITE